MNTDKLVFERSIQAPVHQVYLAFTNSSAIREWLCDAVTTDPRPGGRIYLWWNTGYYTSGEFIQLEPDKTVAFTWQGRGEPAPTKVEITLSESQGAVQLKLVHSGLAEGQAWAKAAQEFTKGWENNLENLAHTLEKGPDLRITMRPMMGIALDDFNESIAKELGVPVSQGVRISNAIDGMGAQAAGIRKNDVVVGLSGNEISDFASLTAAMQGRKAGEEVQMTLYRGNEKMTIPMKLSFRPIPEIPPTTAALGEAVRLNYAQDEADLDAFLEGLSEEEASRRPNDKDWSVKGILAHLIHNERGWQNAIGEIITSSEPAYDNFGGNLDERVNATLAAYPTLKDLATELKRLFAESQALLASLSPEFMARKSSYWRIGFQALQFNQHFQLHLEQMKAVIQAIRQ
jgi:uncharacterized protein YndB with AHSA1/START domain